MKIETTLDGSSTIFIPEWNERYHSKNGAIQESLYVYIEKGLLHLSINNIRILEIGLGTGLNVLLTLLYQRTGTNIQYNALEPNPLPYEIYQNLNYTHMIGQGVFNSTFQIIHQSPENLPQILNNRFIFIKHFQKIQEFSSSEKFDLVYWDAFGPRVQPEMWSLDLCQKVYELLNVGGIIVTYCSQGQFKRNLKQVGFLVESLPGPPFKREMTRAIKKNQKD